MELILTFVGVCLPECVLDYSNHGPKVGVAIPVDRTTTLRDLKGDLWSEWCNVDAASTADLSDVDFKRAMEAYFDRAVHAGCNLDIPLAPWIETPMDDENAEFPFAWFSITIKDEVA